MNCENPLVYNEEQPFSEGLERTLAATYLVMAWLVMIPMMEVQEAFGYVRLSFSLGLCLGKVILPFCIDVPEVFDQKRNWLQN